MTETKRTLPHRAGAFRKTRDAHLAEIAEDYVQMIAELTVRFGEARLIDLATNLGVSSANAGQILQRLRREGLVQGERYRALFLTAEGTALAARVGQRRRRVYDFLRALGVDEVTAIEDAEGLEHHVSDATLVAMAQLVARLETDPPPPG